MRIVLWLLRMQKKKKKVVFSLPSQQPDGEAGQPAGMEDEPFKNEVGSNIKQNSV